VALEQKFKKIMTWAPLPQIPDDWSRHAWSGRSWSRSAGSAILLRLG
jgi:hypothetical protein